MAKKVVIPAKAGIQVSIGGSWIPVFTGMTEKTKYQRDSSQRVKL